jgi:hypothetical protein
MNSAGRVSPAYQPATDARAEARPYHGRGQQYSRGMPSNAAAPGVHPPNEQYLEAILYLEEEGSQVIQARLAEHVGHSAPTVSEMVHRLKEAGYVEVKGRSIILTVSGRKLATSVIRKHRLAGAAPDRRDRAPLAQGARRSRPMGARHLRRRGGPPGRDPREP